MSQSARDRYHLLPNDHTLKPSNPVQGVEEARQIASMLDLREMHNDVTRALLKRDRQMQAWALSNSVSRQDMGIAVGISKSRVDQIIRELTQSDNARKAREAIERVRRHMPEDLFQEWLRRQPEIAAEFEATNKDADDDPGGLP